MIGYSTNWMGVINLQWYRDRGLTQRVSRTLTEDSKLTGRRAGDVFEYDENLELIPAANNRSNGRECSITRDELINSVCY